MTSTLAAPVYDRLHRGHPQNDPKFGCVGFDVIRTTWTDGDGPHQLTVEVTAIFDGPASYLDALAAAKLHREAPCSYGFPASRYACGCRWIATSLDGDDVTFIDLPRPEPRTAPAFTVCANGAVAPAADFRGAVGKIAHHLAQHARAAADVGDLADAGLYFDLGAEVVGTWLDSPAIPDTWTWTVHGPDHLATYFEIRKEARA